MSNGNDLLLHKQTYFPAYLLCLILILFIGTRPISWMFVDMIGYAQAFNAYQGDLQGVNWDGEWGLPLLVVICKRLGISIQGYFLIVAIGYIGLPMIVCRQKIWENPGFAFLFCISAFSFWGFGTNGIRNGLACSLTLMGISQLNDKKYISMVLLYVLALGVHKSTILPISMSLIAYTIAKSPKYAIYIWMSSIIVSLFVGNSIANFFANLGFDDRMTSYVTMGNTTQGFAYTGFRWDFLLYSSVPVWLTWYISEEKQIHDTTFNLFAITYILCNSFWIMVIRAAFSNRFAYLSWFIYPIVIAYAFIRIPIWNDQDKKSGWALLLHCTFTIFMFLIGKLH